MYDEIIIKVGVNPTLFAGDIMGLKQHSSLPIIHRLDHYPNIALLSHAILTMPRAAL